jgi:hypothetical protein
MKDRIKSMMPNGITGLETVKMCNLLSGLICIITSLHDDKRLLLAKEKHYFFALFKASTAK